MGDAECFGRAVGKETKSEQKYHWRIRKRKVGKQKGIEKERKREKMGRIEKKRRKVKGKSKS